MIRFALTIFLSAFLLFQVQPLIGRYILPWFGGGPAVWTTCMLFFQVALLVGYGYAHLISTRLSGRAQSWLHLSLLAVSLFLLPISPDAEIWKPSPDDKPTLHILWLLTANVGAPYLLLSSTAPLTQRWFAVTFSQRSPYRLYALSNIGSLLALLSYPFFVEPALALRQQVLVWSWAYVLFAALCGWCAIRIAWKGSGPLADTYTDTPIQSPGTSGASAAGYPGGNPVRPSLSTISLWLALAAGGSSMLLATTNQMCQEVAVVPFLWVLPLSFYLLTFVICFDHDRWYDRFRFGLLMGVMAILASVVLFGGVWVDLRIQILVFSLTLFACCMTCHGELVRSKPHAQHLTLFYLVVAAGGALGGLLVAVVAPRLFPGYWEYHISLAGCVFLTLVSWYRAGAIARYFPKPAGLWARLGAMQLALVVILGTQAYMSGKDAVVISRNFYGVLQLTEVEDKNGARRSLSHGRIVHGFQFTDPEKRTWPTAYYGPQSGIGLALRNHPRRHAANPGDRALRVGVVGLGAGTLAAYGQPRDYFRFYEINPEVLRFSERFFTYSKDTGARIDVVLGDARVQLERELADNGSQHFDVLAVDAFSSDAIPIHLITNESAEIYWEHLKDDGLLMFHITNRSIDLAPVVRGLAKLRGCQPLYIRSEEDPTKGVSRAIWMILTNNRIFLENPVIRKATMTSATGDERALVWTDDFASLWQVLKN